MSFTLCVERNREVKRVLVALLIISLIIIIVPSCRKKTSDDDTAAADGVQESVTASDGTSSYRTLSEPESLTVAAESGTSASSSAGTFSFTPQTAAEDEKITRTATEEEKSTQSTTDGVKNIQTETGKTETARPGSSADCDESSVLVDASSARDEKPLTFVNEAESSAEAFTLNEFYRGGEILIKASFTNDGGELVFNVDESEVRKILSALSLETAQFGEISYSLTGSLLEITYPETTEEKVEEKWQYFKNFLNSYNNEKSSLVDAEEDELVISKTAETTMGTLSASIHSDRAEITVPEAMTEEETAAFISWIVSEYPEAAEYGTYSISDGRVNLVYSSLFSNRLASDAFDELASLVDTYFSLSSSSEKEENTVVTGDEDVVAAVSTVSGAEEAAEVARKEGFIRGYSVSGYVTPSFNTSSSRFNIGAGLRAEIHFRNWLSIGMKAGGNFSFGYIQTGIYGRFTFVEFDRLDLYATTGVDIDYSIKGGKLTVAFGAAIGVKYDILDNLSVFVEIGYQYSLIRKSDVYATVGVSYRF